MELLKLNDIRVGDWFVHLHGLGMVKIFTVESCCKCVVMGGDIAEAVLEHCGFKEEFSIYYYHDGKIAYNPMARLVAYIDENGYHGIPWRVEHLHQLQHIFYELTGKELEADMFGLSRKLKESMAV